MAEHTKVVSDSIAAPFFFLSLAFLAISFMNLAAGTLPSLVSF